MFNLGQPETVTSIKAIVDFMELMFPGLVCFMIFQLLSERKLNMYLNISEIFLYTIFIQIITHHLIISGLLGLLLGIGLNFLYQKERFFKSMRKIGLTKKSLEGNLLWVYLHKEDDRNSIITFKNDDIVEGQILNYSKDDNHLFIYNPVWIKNSNPSNSDAIIIHLYVSIDDIRYIEFKISKKDKEKLIAKNSKTIYTRNTIPKPDKANRIPHQISSNPDFQPPKNAGAAQAQSKRSNI